MAYRFHCKNCGHEYVRDEEYAWRCQDCGTMNQTYSKF